MSWEVLPECHWYENRGKTPHHVVLSSAKDLGGVALDHAIYIPLCGLRKAIVIPNAAPAK